MLKEASRQFLQKSKLIILLLLGTISWSWTMVKSGWLYSYGLGFWGANGHDGIWHIALAESLSKGGLEMPIFAGVKIQNYHLGFDLILTILHKITFLPIVNLYFQIIPPILAFLVGFLTYKFVLTWTKSRVSAFWSTFFVYFGGSLGWVMGRGESAFWSQESISSLINPPFALSLVILLVGLIFLLKLEKKTNFWNFFISVLSFGALIEIKAYAGILALGALFVIGIWRLVRSRNLSILSVFLFSLIFSILLYIPFNKSASRLLVLQPFWFLETMMGSQDRVGWLKFFSAMNTYKSGHVWIKLIPAYFIAFIIFLTGNLGTRIIFLFKKIKFDELHIFVYSIIAAGIVIPLFFLQEGTLWNTIQFFYYSVFFSSILAGVAFSGFLERFKTNTFLRYLFALTIISLTVPTSIITLKDVYIPGRPPAKLSNSELEALDFLKAEPDGIVLTYPFDSAASKMAENNPPRPLYLYTSTAYVSAFSAHPVFLEDEVNLDITGYAWKDRLGLVKDWYQGNNALEAHKFLKENNIKYIYWIKPQRAFLGEGQLGLKNIFENSSVIIYRVE